MPDAGAEFGPMPSADEVRAELERIVASEPFRPSAQLQAFLRFVVEATLKGEAERIRAFTIAVEAFGRDQDFDPQSDPIVRVEAARLRRAIELYYDGAGADDPVEIVVPRGGYVPRFRYRGREPASRERTRAANARQAPRAAPAPPPAAAQRRNVRHAVAAALLVLIAAALGGTLLMRLAPPRQAASLHGARRARAGAPAFAVPAPAGRPDRAGACRRRARPCGDPRAARRRARALRRCRGRGRARGGRIAGARAGGAPNVYRLACRRRARRRRQGERHAAIDRPGRRRGLVAQLRDARRRAGPHRGGRADRARRGPGAGAALRRDLRARTPRARRAPASTGAIAACSTASSIAARSIPRRPASTREIRGCLERTVASDPAFPSAQAALAFVLMREFYAGELRDPKGLDDALRLALRGVELKPGSARARHVLMNILFARGSVAQALARRRAGDRAQSLRHDRADRLRPAARLRGARRRRPRAARSRRAAQPRCARRCSNSPSSW